MQKIILIIEDEHPLREALVLKLKKERFGVLNAKNGEEGLAMAQKEHPDLILLDIVMPKMDGMTMLKKLRQDSWGRKVPVIILTNLTIAEEIAEALDKGVHDYLVKADWKLEDIVDKIRHTLDRK
jgi:DNA-binding response OmpR family regulator